jgi:ABC-type nitrate/sulfonate/bicarbonate transport system substrate-binding protein
LAWCKASSLTAAVARSLRELAYPASRRRVLAHVKGSAVDGWDVAFLLGEALKSRSYGDVREVMKELEAWLEVQG